MCLYRIFGSLFIFAQLGKRFRDQFPASPREKATEQITEGRDAIRVPASFSHRTNLAILSEALRNRKIL